MTKRQLLTVLLLAAAPNSLASAQTTIRNSGWLPWFGCWRADGAPENEFLCVTPDGAGARLYTVVDGAIRGESQVFTDGRARRVDADGCTGTEMAHWSADGRRVYLNSELNCQPDVTRKVSGIFTITAAANWLSVQSVDIDGKIATRTTRYRVAEPRTLPPVIANALRDQRPAAAAARLNMLAALEPEDVSEAVRAVDGAAVQEWLTVTGQPYSLDDDSSPETTSFTSALDIVGDGTPVTYTREVVHYVERPVYYHDVHYVRSCWDPFYAGAVSVGIGRDVYIGLGYGGSACGRHYYSRYSPWGYDLYGWRSWTSPVVYVHGGPVIIRKGPTIINRINRDRRHYPARGGHNRDAYDRDSRYDDSGARATRNGYTNSAAPGTRNTSTTAGTRTPSARTPTTRSVRQTTYPDRSQESYREARPGRTSPPATQDRQYSDRTAQARGTETRVRSVGPSSPAPVRSVGPSSMPRPVRVGPSSGSSGSGSTPRSSTAQPRTAKPRTN